jgi:hypothetical protein
MAQPTPLIILLAETRRFELLKGFITSPTLIKPFVSGLVGGYATQKVK